MKNRYEGEEQARRAIEANVTPRYMRLQELESWVEGRQYDGRPDWWSETEIPLWERKPCFVYPVVKVAIGSNVDLVFGEGRFPAITSKPSEDESDDEGGLGEDQSKDLDRFIRELHKVSRFKSHCREAFAAAQATGTAVAIHGLRFGKPFNDLIPAQWGTPSFNLDGSVSALDIRYPYLKEQKVDGKWTLKAKLYRRTIDAENDVTYLPADAREDGAEPAWVADPNRSIKHGLGFCPVIWYPFMLGCSTVERIDGHAIHANLRDEIQTLDLSLSEKARCQLFSEPQPVEIGVTPGYNPTGQDGRTAIVPSTELGGEGPEAGASTGGYIYGKRSMPARKKGPGFVWQYADPKTKVEFLAFPSGLLKEHEEHCNDLLSKIEQGLSVVLPKPSEFKFASSVSGRSLQETKSRQYDRCDQYRDDLEQAFLLPSVSMQLRIAQRVREQMRVAGVQKVLKVLDRFSEEEA